ncbi:DUF2634 domain-containing protein [Oscillibacter sp.]|uniref:DUF2634 domain-containing protein n=1 Tax=Oscillibacter sp. TaxID=1945593 RepID=UPI00289BB1A1|nr:DUF2634 domain-containing protein [Oscillibacter sp.]
MSSIFPVVQPEAEETASALPLAREIKWDFQSGVPVFSAGEPVIVSGAEAVRVWCWKALKTPRYRHDIYTWDYGSEAEDLIGKAFTADVKRSEAIRYIREALLVSPYITGVGEISVGFAGDRLTVQCSVSTVYGEVDFNV